MAVGKKMLTAIFHVKIKKKQPFTLPQIKRKRKIERRLYRRRSILRLRKAREYRDLWNFILEVLQQFTAVIKISR